MKTIFCDGIFDLFHRGHLKHLEKIHRHFDEPIYLIVGVTNDVNSTKYKRQPIYDENKRVKILESCIYVNKVILLTGLVVTQELMKNHHIDLVVHAFQDKQDYQNLYQYYKYPIQNNAFISLQYNKGISTTDIIKQSNLKPVDMIKSKHIKEINSQTYLLGKTYQFVTNVVARLNIQSLDNILEMGWGPCNLATYFDHFISPENYIRVDTSNSSIHQHIHYPNHCFLYFKTSDTVFKTNYFDFAIGYGLLEHVTCQEELHQVFQEMERVSKKGIYFGSICSDSLNKEYFIDRGYTITYANYDEKKRYDAFKILK